jgi:hypothetical protein
VGVLNAGEVARMTPLMDAWVEERHAEFVSAARGEIPAELEPLVRVMTRLALEHLRRFDEAWTVQQKLLKAAPVGFLKGVGHAIRLLPAGARRVALIAELKGLARTEGSGIEHPLSRFRSGLTEALGRAEPAERRVTAPQPVAAAASPADTGARAARPRRAVTLPALPIDATLDDRGPPPADQLETIEPSRTPASGGRSAQAARNPGSAGGGGASGALPVIGLD